MTMKINDGGPAFPQDPNGMDDLGGWIRGPFPGISLRAYFAGQALTGICANPIVNPMWKERVASQFADAVLDMADALIAELEKQG